MLYKTSKYRVNNSHTVYCNYRVLSMYLKKIPNVYAMMDVKDWKLKVSNIFLLRGIILNVPL